jgi:hypothetical protein
MRSGINFRSAGVFTCTALIALALGACDKAPLLAPTNSTISLSANTRTLPLGGSTEVSAYVIEQAGTPVQNGTTVRFTTNLGRVDPVEVETRNGQATTMFFAGDASGVAEIRAISGAAGSGASTGTGGTTPGGTTPAGSTAGNVVQITIGAAAVEAVTISTNPSTISANGGTVDVVAVVTGTGARAVSGVAVTFSADRGTLSSTTAVTDASGQVQLTTNADTTVTATAGGKTTTTAAKVTAQPGPSVALTCTSSTSSNCSTLNVGDVAVFTAARGTTTSNIRTAILDFGDGTSVDLGNLSGSTTAAHQYTQAGTYSVRLNATDVNGEATTSTVIVIVQEAATVVLNLNAPTTRRIDATATVTGCTPQRYDWNFGTDAETPTLTTTGNSASAIYNNGGTKTVTVTVRCTDGRTTQTSSQRTLQATP